MTDNQTTDTSRRQLLTMAVVGGAGLFAAPDAQAATAHQHPGRGRGKGFTLTVLGTTDLHGNVYNWNYFNNAAYSDSKGNQIGIAKAATLIKGMRAERGADRCLTLDAGDTIQGTPLAYYYAKIDPITGGSRHPMATAMNAVGYDAAALGNHEYNYGLDTLRTYQRQLPLPAAVGELGRLAHRPPGLPAVRAQAGQGARPEAGHGRHPRPGHPRRGDLGQGQRRGQGALPRHRRAGHGDGAADEEGGCRRRHRLVPLRGRPRPRPTATPCPTPRTPAPCWPSRCPTSTRSSSGTPTTRSPQAKVKNTVTGREVLLSEPLYWGMRVSVMDLDLEQVHGRWRVRSSKATLLNANTVPEDAKIAALRAPRAREGARLRQQRDRHLHRGDVGLDLALPGHPRDGLHQPVQAETVKAALVGTPQEGLPVLSIAAPFNKDAAIPAGEVTVRDVAGLYIYDNTLLGIQLTGAQVKDYLEKSATYFKQVSGTGPFAPGDLTNAVTPTAPTGTPDYNYDIMGGLDARLTYDIDVSKDPGARITDLAYAGVPVAADAAFVIAINNYRQSGGGNYPHVTAAPVLYNRQVEIRQLLIDWVTEKGVIDPPSFSSTDWRLVSGGVPVVITG